MKKGIKTIIIIIISLVVGIFVDKLLLINKENNIPTNIKINKKGTFSNRLSMMLETDVGSGEYESTTMTEWSSDGYIFNKELSKCENGGELDWDYENNTVIMIGTSSDKCYVYFDKYTSVVINSLGLSSTPTSISVNVIATAGTGEIVKYMYSIDNGEYIESESSTYTFSNLESSKEYSISVKAIDSNGLSSLVKTEKIETLVYVLVNITNLTTSVTASTITVTPVITQGTGTISKYYYSKDGGSSYTESTSSTYTFTGLTGGTTYSIKVYVKDLNGKTSNTYTKSVSTSNLTLAAYIKGLYTGIQGDNGLYYHTSSLTNGANDGSYRYAGADPNNYVCFGSNEETCPTDNLYRIIGVFGDQVKLIKWDYATQNELEKDSSCTAIVSNTNANDSSVYYLGNNYNTALACAWDKNRTQSWSSSLLQSASLNTTYLSKIGSEWAKKIISVTWKVAGLNGALNGYNSYQNEVASPTSATIVNAKIGLMYVSDYGYAVPPSAWTIALNNYDSVKTSNWLYMGLNEWMIFPELSTTYYAFQVTNKGKAVGIISTSILAIRPCFYLNSTVTYTGVGDGQKDSPYRIA